MSSLLTVLPLAFVMIAGPQFISAVFLATSEDWKKNSAAYLAGVLLTVTFFVSLAYIVVKSLQSSSGGSGGKTTRQGVTVVILLLLVYAAWSVFHSRKTAEPPKWMGKLQGADARFSFKLGLLLLGVFPTDFITSTTVGSTLAREGDPLYDCALFILVTLFLLALPALLVVVMGERAVHFLPKVRDWMNTNSWIVSELVIALFIGIQINTLLSS